jgi:hypothetical protein
MAQRLVLVRPNTQSEMVVPVSHIFGDHSEPLDHGCLEALRELYFPEWVIDQVLTD